MRPVWVVRSLFLFTVLSYASLVYFIDEYRETRERRAKEAYASMFEGVKKLGAVRTLDKPSTGFNKVEKAFELSVGFTGKETGRKYYVVWEPLPDGRLITSAYLVEGDQRVKALCDPFVTEGDKICR